MKTIKTTIPIRFAGKNKKMVIRETTDKIDSLKQAQAIIPNIIHSLDANHIITLVNKAQKDGIFPIITIHDCFGTHPNKMLELNNRVKTEFILLYTQDQFLNKFHNRLIQSIKDNQFSIKENFDPKENIKNNYVEFGDTLLKIPNLPKMGELDLNNLARSKYFIS